MKLNPKLILLPAALLVAPLLGLLLLDSALTLVGLGDETHPSPSVLESNFDLPCSELSIKESTWNPDLNVLVVDLKSPPPPAFFEALRQRGWSCRQGNSETSYLMDNTSLVYRSDTRQLVMRPTSYTEGSE